MSGLVKVTRLGSGGAGLGLEPTGPDSNLRVSPLRLLSPHLLLIRRLGGRVPGVHVRPEE